MQSKEEMLGGCPLKTAHLDDVCNAIAIPKRPRSCLHHSQGRAPNAFVDLAS